MATQNEPQADALAWASLAATHREAQDMPQALAAFERAAACAPDYAEWRFRIAQTRFEMGLDSADLFGQLRRSAPQNLMIVAAEASALAAERHTDRAIACLDAALVQHPDWIEGHKSLAAIRLAAGEPKSEFARSFAPAISAKPANLALRLASFHIAALTKQWDMAQSIVADGEAVIGSRSAFTLARLFVACETHDDAQARALFAQTSDLTDAGLELCRVRFGLRTGDFAMAETAALRLLQTPASANAWPYLSLLWRSRGDARAQWLDAPDVLVKSFDLDFTRDEIDQLALTLRRLHAARAPQLEQSVRGGSQTERQLFFRTEPIIQTVRAKILAAVGDYVSALPPVDLRHPLLGARRDALRFAGSWSVRLRGAGYHVAHTHPMGWISSALYVALPAPDEMGAPPAGWIGFGAPPPELGLNLPPYHQVEPKVGRLVLFPSTMWHATEPFVEGERLVIAFDMARC